MYLNLTCSGKCLDEKAFSCWETLLLYQEDDQTIEAKHAWQYNYARYKY